MNDNMNRVEALRTLCAAMFGSDGLITITSGYLRQLKNSGNPLIQADTPAQMEGIAKLT